jgi:hypothetical protein
MIDLNNIRNFTVARPEGLTVFGNAKDFDALPETHKEQLLFLNKSASTYLFSFTGPAANLLTGGSWDPFAKGNFKSVEEFSGLSNTAESNQNLKKWLYRRGIAFKTWVFVLFEGYDDPILMTWKMVVKYSDIIIFGEDVMVFDSSLNWCLFYFHENQLFFGKDNRYDPTENDQRMQALNERKKKYPQFKHPYL